MSETDGNNHADQCQSVDPPGDPQPQSIRMLVEQELRGPLPPPQVLAEYDRHVPGSADRILTMAENGQQHHMAMEREQLELERETLRSVNNAIANENSRGKWGIGAATIIALSGMGVGGWLTWSGYGGFGLGFLFVSIGSLVSTFLYRAWDRRASTRAQVEDRPDG